MALERMEAGQTLSWEVSSNILKAYLLDSFQANKCNSLGIGGWGTRRNVVNALSLKTFVKCRDIF
jgi:hypothetical protein